MTKPYKSPEQRPQVFETRLDKALHQLRYFKEKTDREVRSCSAYMECCTTGAFLEDDSWTTQYSCSRSLCRCRPGWYIEKMGAEDE